MSYVCFFATICLADLYFPSRRRAIATAEIFGSAILDHSSTTGEAASPHHLIIRKDLLDDSNAAKEPMDRVKKRLKVLLRPGEYKRPEFAFAWRVPNVEPQQVVQETVELLRYHRQGERASLEVVLHWLNIFDAVMRDNWTKMDVEAIQSRWCCAEYPELWKERWDKIFGEFCDVEPEKFDPSRVCCLSVQRSRWSHIDDYLATADLGALRFNQV